MYAIGINRKPEKNPKNFQIFQNYLHCKLFLVEYSIFAGLLDEKSASSRGSRFTKSKRISPGCFCKLCHFLTKCSCFYLFTLIEGFQNLTNIRTFTHNLLITGLDNWHFASYKCWIFSSFQVEICAKYAWLCLDHIIPENRR